MVNRTNRYPTARSVSAVGASAGTFVTALRIFDPSRVAGHVGETTQRRHRIRAPRSDNSRWVQCANATNENDCAATTQVPEGGRAMAESGAAQSLDTLRCLISQVPPSGTKVSR